ncbi:MAG: recombinase family protein [Casimicrobium sp.]
MNTRTALSYERVSTDNQTNAAQSHANANYAKSCNLPIHWTIQETCSGATKWRDRDLNTVVNGDPIPTDLLVYELSRVGRNLADVLDFLQVCVDRGITVHITSKGTRIDAGLHGKILATMLALCAEIEREHVRERTRAALAERRSQIMENGFYKTKAGKIRTSLGHQPGTPRRSKLDGKAEEIAKLKSAGVSDSAIARLLSVDRKTVARQRSKTNTTKESTTHE